ncbi:hypothetical protein Acr_20g0009670 [Actinidia rufa]|uniref:Uncharacterized protein n=1 Tax=Actinidia rufa TaxID=165716 RepID=A0A7J0GEE5_9ERIC|nr:hypothetical protein Acr_20g0009670 [Actinidia rufa]
MWRRCPLPEALFVRYLVVAKAQLSVVREFSSDFATDVAGFTREIVLSTVGNVSGYLGISRVFLSALSQSLLQVLPFDANKLVSCLLDKFVSYLLNSLRELVPTPQDASSHSSPIIVNHYQPNDGTSPKHEASNAFGLSSSSALRVSVMNGDSFALKNSMVRLVLSIRRASFNVGEVGSAAAY